MIYIILLGSTPKDIACFLRISGICNQPSLSVNTKYPLLFIAVIILVVSIEDKGTNKFSQCL